MSELFTHQKEGITFLKEKRKAILADEMGLGKTRQAILAAGETSDKGILVICPASLKLNWEREIKAVYPEDETYVVESGPAFPFEKASWFIINYDMLPKYAEYILGLMNNGEIETVIIDEAHYIKGKSIRAEQVLGIVKGAGQVYCLTGTPLLNRPIELFNLLRAVGHPLGKVKTVFAKRYCGGQMKTLVRDIKNGRSFFVDPKRAYPYRMQKDKYKVFTFLDDTGATHLDELKRFTADIMLRREKKDVLDLPEKIITHVETKLTPDWRKAYDDAWDKYLMWVESNPDGERDIENIKSAQQLIELGKLKQVCSLAKLERIAEDVENIVEQGEKVIIFSQYTKTIKDISEELFRRKIGNVTLTGDNDQNERQGAVDAFQTSKQVQVFIANIKAGGVGITLTAATIVIFADFDWSPGVNAQAEDRAHRIGQNGTVNVYYYVCKDTAEEDIIRLLREKSEVISNILEK